MFGRRDRTDRQVFTDFILADFLVSCTPYVNEVVFQYAMRPLLNPHMLTRQSQSHSLVRSTRCA